MHVRFVHAGQFLLSLLKGSAHLVKVLGKGTCVYAGKTWQAILLVPVAHKLKCSDSLTLFCHSVMCVIVARHVAQELAICLCA